MIEKKPIPLVDVRELIKARAESMENAVLTYEQNQSDDYVKKFAKLSKAQAKELMEELQKVEVLDAETRVKIVDILPDDLETLKLLVPKNAKASEEDLNGILRHVKKHAST